MAESLVQVTEGTGKKLHTWQRTVGANAVEDDFSLPGLIPYPTYTVIGSGLTFATGSDHMLQIMAGASLNVYVTRIRAIQRAVGTAATLDLSVFRLTTAGTGGGAITPRPMDSSDVAAGATGMSNPTVKGTEGVELWRDRLTLVTAAPIVMPSRDLYVAQGIAKAIRIPTGATNGIALKNTGAGIATDTADIVVELIELSY